MSTNKRIKLSEKENKKLEIFATLALIVFALISYLISTFLIKKDRRNISVFVNGVQITEVNGNKLDLNLPGTYTIGDPNTEYNVIEIKDHRVRCIDANCPDKICVSHGYLNPDIDNDIIVCAPHKLLIQYQ